MERLSSGARTNMRFYNGELKRELMFKWGTDDGAGLNILDFPAYITYW